MAAEVAGGLERGLDAVNTTYSIICPPATLKEIVIHHDRCNLGIQIACRIHSSTRCFTGMMRRADNR